VLCEHVCINFPMLKDNATAYQGAWGQWAKWHRLTPQRPKIMYIKRVKEINSLSLSSCVRSNNKWTTQLLTTATGKMQTLLFTITNKLASLLFVFTATKLLWSVMTFCKSLMAVGSQTPPNLASMR
jgi:hypothetical protein